MEYNRPHFQPTYVNFLSDSQLANSILTGSKEAYLVYLNSTLASAQKSWAKFVIRDGVKTADVKLEHFSQVPCLHGPDFDSLDSVLPDSDLLYFYGTSHEVQQFVECGNFLCADVLRFVVCTESPYAEGVTAQFIHNWYNRISPGSRLSLHDVGAFFAFLPSVSFSRTIHTVVEIHGARVRKFVCPTPGSWFRGEVVAFGAAFPPPPEVRPTASFVKFAKRSGWDYFNCFQC
ncbi:RolB family protein [Agrobacterium tumefaciens]|uniref:RolB family protein n=1 Tax=Agrobacterium tumefaciens TaxID=358 RepID=UPI001572108A